MTKPLLFQQVVNRLTNWQRNQWARAGYPGLRHQETKPMWKFVRKKRPKR